MTAPWKMLFATVALGAGLSATGVAYAAPQDNHCWGQTTKVFQAVGEPGMGEHTSSHSNFTPDPGDGGRRGVGNVSKEDFGNQQNVGDGSQGVHAATVFKQFADSGFNDDPELFESLPEECQALVP